MSEYAEEPSATTADLADLMIALINIWTAIDALGRELPDGSDAQRQIELSRQGMTEALRSIMRRHDMDIQWSSDGQGDADPA